MNALALKSPRPFSSLGLKPFLFATEENLIELKKIYIEKSRKLHPDRHAHLDDNQKAELERELSELNHDYLRLRDPFKLINEIVSSNCPSSHASLEKAPPTLAARYFDLQEIWEEKGIADPKAKEEAAALLQDVERLKLEAENSLFSLARLFPYEGLGASDPHWTLMDLEKMRKFLHLVRYYQSFAHDIESKYGHSN